MDSEELACVSGKSFQKLIKSSDLSERTGHGRGKKGKNGFETGAERERERDVSWAQQVRVGRAGMQCSPLQLHWSCAGSEPIPAPHHRTGTESTALVLPRNAIFCCSPGVISAAKLHISNFFPAILLLLCFPGFMPVLYRRVFGPDCEDQEPSAVFKKSWNPANQLRPAGEGLGR